MKSRILPWNIVAYPHKKDTDLTGRDIQFALVALP